MFPDTESRLRLLAAELRAECARIATTVAEIDSAGPAWTQTAAAFERFADHLELLADRLD